VRDEMDARIWVEHHQAFAETVDAAIAALRSGLARFAQWDGSTHQLIALVVAFLLTGLNFSGVNAVAA
jgi:hypothetical protein